MFNNIFDEIETWMRELLTGIIKANLDRIALSVSSLQLWVDEQIAIGKMKPPVEEQ